MKKLILLCVLAPLGVEALTMKVMSPYEHKTAWVEKSIRVCWGDENHQSQTLAVNDKFDFIPYSAEQKKWIKDIITQEFKLDDVGIEFTGWENCPPKVESEVVLFRIEPQISEDTNGSFSESGGRATIGRKGSIVSVLDATSVVARESYESSGYPHVNYVVLNTRAADERRMDRANYVKTLALHEFGHTAGLRHAHVRLKEAKADPNCKRVPEIQLKEEPVFTSTRFAGGYDFNSIMNYCYINVLISKTGLSFRARGPEHQIKLTDQTLYTSTVVNEKKQDYRVRIGLSSQDKRALMCMYRPGLIGLDKSCNQPK